jgi:nucleotide-binding universal stress UspA family protein
MFKKILIPVDLTDKHQPALTIAAELAAKSQGEAALLHVIEVIPGLAFEEEKSFYGRLEHAAQEHLDRLGKLLEKQKVRWHPKVIYGNRTAATVRFAGDWQADLIILTAPQLDRTHPESGWGSLSYKISILAACPVLLVK